MSRYIDADAAKKDADERGMEFFLDLTDVDEMKRFLDAQPTADVEEARHGEWIASPVRYCRRNTNHKKYHCSECGKNVGNRPNYKRCPECGAKMDGGSK